MQMRLWFTTVLAMLVSCSHFASPSPTVVQATPAPVRIQQLQELPAMLPATPVNYRASTASLSGEFAFVHERFTQGACPPEVSEPAEVWFEIVCPYKSDAAAVAEIALEDPRAALEALHTTKRPSDKRKPKRMIQRAQVDGEFASRHLRNATFQELLAVAAILRGKHFDRTLVALGTQCTGPAWGWPSERNPGVTFVPVVYEYVPQGELALNLDPSGDMHPRPDLYPESYCFLGAAPQP